MIEPMKTLTRRHLAKLFALSALVILGADLSIAQAAPSEARLSVVSVTQALRTGEGQRKAIYAVNRVGSGAGSAAEIAATQVVTVDAAWLQANPQAAEAVVREYAQPDGAIPDARLAARVKAALQLTDGARLNALFAPEVARRALAGK